MAAIDFPASPTTGQLFSAANGVTYRYDGTLWLVQAGPGGGTGDFYAIQSASPYGVGTTPANAPTTLIISGNSGAWFNTSTQRYTPPAGRYTLYGGLTSSQTSTIIAVVTQIYKNGALTGTFSSGSGSSGGNTFASAQVIADANGTDYFELKIHSSPGSTGQTCYFGAYPLTGMAGPVGPPFGGGTGDVDAMHTAAYTIPVAGSDTVLPFDTVLVGNAGGVWSTSTNRYTPPAGRYSMRASVVLNAPASGSVGIALRKNGTRTAPGYVQENSGGATRTVSLHLAETVDANGTDYFEWVISVASGTTWAGSRFSAFPLTGMQGPQGPTGPVGSVPVIRVQKFTASGTYTPHANMQSGYVVGIGGGGAGGAYTGTAGNWQGAGGGASGSKVTTFLSRAQVVPNVAVTIGAGGVAVTGGPGGTGGSTIFGSLLTAVGGGGGSQFSGGAFAGGGVGDIIEGGFPGGASMQMAATGMAATSVGGQGGGAWGALGIAVGSSASQGNAGGANTGGGGAGTASANAAAAFGASNGGSGYLYVVEYCSA